jgi:hypothetical protein
MHRDVRRRSQASRDPDPMLLLNGDHEPLLAAEVHLRRVSCYAMLKGGVVVCTLAVVWVQFIFHLGSGVRHIARITLQRRSGSTLLYGHLDAAKGEALPEVQEE